MAQQDYIKAMEEAGLPIDQTVLDEIAARQTVESTEGDSMTVGDELTDLDLNALFATTANDLPDDTMPSDGLELDGNMAVFQAFDTPQAELQQLEAMDTTTATDTATVPIDAATATTISTTATSKISTDATTIVDYDDEQEDDFRMDDHTKTTAASAIPLSQTTDQVRP